MGIWTLRVMIWWVNLAVVGLSLVVDCPQWALFPFCGLRFLKSVSILKIRLFKVYSWATGNPREMLRAPSYLLSLQFPV